MASLALRKNACYVTLRYVMLCERSYSVKQQGATNLDEAVDNKHLMTGPEGNSEFFFPENVNVSRDEVEGNIEIRGKQNSLFPKGLACVASVSVQFGSKELQGDEWSE